MKNELFPAAETRPVEDLNQLAAQINAAHEAGEAATRQGLEDFREAGESLIKAKAQCGHGKWLPWLKKNVRFADRTARVYMQVAREWDKLADSANLLEAIRSLEDAPNDDDDDIPTSQPPPEYITLEQWNEASEKARTKLLKPRGDVRFNAQGDNTNIQWALWSWNPITGCLHNCPYCYARDIAERFYDQKFAPSIWPGRLSAPKNTPFPEEKASEWMGHKNVFTCSMADLFGRWVPREWIDAVLTAVREAPQWNFLFLTKFPIRMAEFDFPDNTWVGTTVDCQARVANAEKSFRKVKAGKKWLSLEPLIEPLQFQDLGAFDWVVVGGASKSSQTPEWHPPLEWVLSIQKECQNAGISLYEKTNLMRGLIQGYPGEPAEWPPNEAPKALRYLPTPEARS